jgi:hypothetical protein
VVLVPRNGNEIFFNPKSKEIILRLAMTSKLKNNLKKVSLEQGIASYI